MKKSFVQYGFIAGVIIVVYSAIVILIFGDYSNATIGQLQMAEILGYLRYIFLIMAVILGMRDFKSQTDMVSFWPLFRTGFAISLIIAVFTGLIELIYVMAYPDFYDHYSNVTIDHLKQINASSQEISDYKNRVDMFRWRKNPLASSVYYFFETFLVGIICAMLAGVLFRTRSRHLPPLKEPNL